MPPETPCPSIVKKVRNGRVLFRAFAGPRSSAFSLHDLRRTFITTAESLDIPAYALKRLLNHADGDVTAGYIILDNERLRAPMQRIADYLVRAMGIDGSNVVSISSADTSAL
jgi:integrase